MAILLVSLVAALSTGAFASGAGSDTTWNGEMTTLDGRSKTGQQLSLKNDHNIADARLAASRHFGLPSRGIQLFRDGEKGFARESTKLGTISERIWVLVGDDEDQGAVTESEHSIQTPEDRFCYVMARLHHPEQIRLRVVFPDGELNMRRYNGVYVGRNREGPGELETWKDLQFHGPEHRPELQQLNISRLPSSPAWVIQLTGNPWSWSFILRDLTTSQRPREIGFGFPLPIATPGRDWRSKFPNGPSPRITVVEVEERSATTLQRTARGRSVRSMLRRTHAAVAIQRAARRFSQTRAPMPRELPESAEEFDLEAAEEARFVQNADLIAQALHATAGPSDGTPGPQAQPSDAQPVVVRSIRRGVETRIHTTLLRGDRVKLHGLVTAKDLNEKTGTITKWLPAQGRWTTKLDDQPTKKPVNVKPANLERVASPLGDLRERVVMQRPETVSQHIAFYKPGPNMLKLLAKSIPVVPTNIWGIIERYAMDLNRSLPQDYVMPTGESMLYADFAPLRFMPTSGAKAPLDLTELGSSLPLPRVDLPGPPTLQKKTQHMKLSLDSRRASHGDPQNGWNYPIRLAGVAGPVRVSIRVNFKRGSWTQGFQQENNGCFIGVVPENEVNEPSGKLWQTGYDSVNGDLYRLRKRGRLCALPPLEDGVITFEISPSERRVTYTMDGCRNAPEWITGGVFGDRWTEMPDLPLSVTQVLPQACLEGGGPVLVAIFSGGGYLEIVS